MHKQILPHTAPSPYRVAIIAGTGILPIEAVRSLQASATPFFVLSLFPEDNGEQLYAETADIISESVYKVSAILRLLKQQGATHVLFIGKVDKRHLLKKLSYDWLLTKLLAKAAFKNDSDLMELLIQEMKNHGIETISQRDVLSNLFVQPGILCGKVTPQLKIDTALGMNVAEQLSNIDIGQTVVVKKGMVLAVEAIEGTDECISRGIALGKSGITVCKTARISQSDQFDIPTLGPNTLAAIKPGQVAVLAWHSTRTMIADYEQFVKMAEEKGITLLCLAEARC